MKKSIRNFLSVTLQDIVKKETGISAVIQFTKMKITGKKGKFNVRGSVDFDIPIVGIFKFIFKIRKKK